MARRPAGRQGVGRRRQRVEWTAGDMETMLSVPANALVVLGSSILMLEAIDSMTSPTLVRVRGEFLAVGATGTIGSSSLMGAGIAVVNRRASDVGATALPRPVTEPDYSWLWHSYALIRFSTGATAEGSNVKRIVVDSKAMRKILSNEEEVVFCFENNSTSDVAILVSISVRILLKES